MKRILSSILASTMILSTFGTSFAQEYAQTTPETQNTEVLQPIETQTLTSGKCGENAYWSYDTSTSTLTISGTGAMINYDWEEIYGKYVSTAPWSSYSPDIKSVVISDGITTIGSHAFGECASLVSITIPNSVTEIGVSSFYWCTSLAELTIPNSVTKIGPKAFHSCKLLTSLTIPDSVTEIGEFAFNWCSSLASITIPNSVTTIEEGTFSSCSSLTSVTLGNSVTKIGNYSFWNNTSLTSVTIPNSITEIGEGAFLMCQSLTTVYYGGSEADRAVMTIDSSYNADLTDATWIYNHNDPLWTGTTPSTPTYTITTTAPSNGIVTLGQTSAEAGERVTLTVNPSTGYMIDSVLVKDSAGNTIPCGYDWAEGCYAFIMPSDSVNITVIFRKIPTITYITQLNQTTGGHFTVGNSNPQEGDQVTITTKPNSGYSVSYVTVYTTSGVRVPCINMGGGVYVYKQPSSAVIVTTTFQNVTVATDKYTDITASDWYTAYVAYVTEHGLMNGMGDGLFQPDTATSRAMVALILALASGEEIPVATTQEFPDVPLGEWYSNGISWCKKNGVVSGYENGNFGTNDAITNEQMVVMMKSFAEYQGMDTKNADSSLLLGYADCNTVSFWAEDAYAWALENEYLQIEGNKLSPQDNASRAEFANILNLFLEND